MNETYRKYLASEHWQKTRTAKRRRAKSCGICGAESRLDVHHLNYRNLIDVGLSDLRVLCRQCHDLAHVLHRRGFLVFDSTDHNHRWARTKAAVKEHFRESRPRPVLVDGIVTLEWLMWFASSSGGWTAAQCIALGVTWPPEKGWLRKRVGQSITPMLAAAFEHGFPSEAA
jgi:hypothetical protein